MNLTSGNIPVELEKGAHSLDAGTDAGWNKSLASSDSGDQAFGWIASSSDTNVARPSKGSGNE